MSSARESGFFLQSTFGSKDNFELVVPSPEGGLQHYWRDNDHPGLLWNGPISFGSGAIDAVAMIQSNFGPGNLEVVAKSGRDLVFYWRARGPSSAWSGPLTIASGVRGNPALIQSSLGRKDNFELVAPHERGGLAHYWRNNDAPGFPWNGPTRFGSDMVDAVAMIQSKLGPGHLEVVARIGTTLVFYWRGNGPSWSWSGPFPFATGAAGRPSLIQSTFGSKDNFELVTPLALGGLAHYWRNNHAPGFPWNGPTRFGTDAQVVACSLLQSNFGPGHRELCALQADGSIAFYWRENGPSWQWHGPQIVTGHKHIDVNVILVGNDHFTEADRQRVADSIEGARAIYETVGFGFGDIRWWGIAAAQAGSMEVVDSNSEADDLTDDWTVPNDALDLFVVRSMNGADGWSPEPGPCNKDENGMTGSVVSLNGDNGNSSNTFAHEMGHYLGLHHVADSTNFIGNNGRSNSSTGIFDWQGNVMKRHCFVKAG